MEARPPEMSLGAAVGVQDVVVDLTGAVGIGEMDEPVPPAVPTVDREGADERCAGAERLEHKTLGGSQPRLLMYGAFKTLQIGAVETDMGELCRKKRGLGLPQERDERFDRERVEHLH